jgi:hypothetical protein
MPDGDLKLTRDPESGDLIYSRVAEAAAPPQHGRNLATSMSEQTLDSLSDMLTEALTLDDEGRGDWEKINTDAIELLGVGPESEPDSEYEAADTSDHPLMLTALLRFQAKSLSALLPSDDQAVNVMPLVDLDDQEFENEAQRGQAQEEQDKLNKRVGQFYAEYLFRRLPSYEEDTDQILHDMGLMGCGLRKIVVDRSRLSTPVLPEYVIPGDLFISYSTSNMRSGRMTHRFDATTSDMIRRFQSGVYRPVKLNDMTVPESNSITRAEDRMYERGGHQQR